MEKFQQLREDAKKRLEVADHILTQTYPLVNDPKLLVAVLENLFLTMSYAMGAILHYERTFKRVPPFQDTFDSKLNMVVTKVSRNHGIKKEQLDAMVQMRDILKEKKKSPVEFRRKDAFVICSDGYITMNEITRDKIKEYLAKTRAFMNTAESITSQNEGIFKK